MNKDGQSIVEYALIAILVILGIVFMGDYVLRSVNSHFKLWDEGVQDSFGEHLRQASVNDVPPINSNCLCSSTTGSCGNPSDPESRCPASQREIDSSCNNPDCNGEPSNSTCVDDTSCCTTAQSLGCGNAALPVADTDPYNNDIGSQVTCPSGVAVGSTCYCPVGSTASSANCPPGTPGGVTCCSTPPPEPSPCYYGQQIWGSQCGSSYPTVCIPVPANVCPMPKCGFYSIYQVALRFCATGTDQPPSSGLTQDTQAAFVTDQTACPNPATCEVYCAPPYQYNASAGNCYPTYYVAAPTCSDTPAQNDPTNITMVSCSHVAGCAGSYSCYVTTNDESHMFCTSDTSYTVTSASSVPADKCGNPGTPKTFCSLVPIYS